MIKLYNTLTRQKEKFKPLNPKEVNLYACGPTVYNFAHIGNLRTYIFEDILKRVLIYNGYKVKHVMNITDVGHLTDDADQGEDKLERRSKREGKTVWEIAEFYTKAFKDDMKKLNISEPNIWCKATDYISEQIDLIKKLEKAGLTYKISDGVYFDTSKYPDYAKLGKLNLEGQKEGARVGKVEEKKNPTDFALWKFSPNSSAGGEKRQMEWGSPWGIGFPGWHIECSAMSMKHLGEEFDIHCGGIDHIPIHHTNERAQNWGATGKEVVKIWMHGAFLNISGEKMAKSESNFLTLKVLEDKSFNPLAYRYLTLQAHYRSQLSFNWESLQAAQNGWTNLYNQIQNLGEYDNTLNYETDKIPVIARSDQRERRSNPVVIAGTSGLLRRARNNFRNSRDNNKSEWTRKVGNNINKNYQKKFLEAINDDLNLPQALAVSQDMLKSNLPKEQKLAAILDFDKVFGLNLNIASSKIFIPDNIKKMAEEREEARRTKDWGRSDEIRKEIEKLGFEIEDGGNGFKIKQKKDG